MDPSVVGRAAVTFSLFLCSLGYVPWRQSRSFETYRALESVRREVSVARAERIELERQIQVLESRARVVPEARIRLGMHTPNASEQVILAVPESM